MIREAESKDCLIIENLYRILAPHSKNIKVLPERIEQIRNDSNNYLFVYEDEGIVKGSIFMTFCLDPAYQFRPYTVVEYVIVGEEFRGNGIGKKLLEQVEQQSITNGSTRIILLSSASRTEAHNFFTRNGYNGTISKGFKKYIPITEPNQ
ncbi:GNAT family N-acetyltransferase [Paenibacillus sp. HWE-109]|uniref:GNAT family N-acetyltransferase n=1 Tax=Paenibacillus sp. HWE-109 TaxID=1306526 RepID=UPI001EDEC974|nr:GNAT family N-acetyltransferase [Paenibacillus sp. HWE-109]UKS29656.1 GNAT family N-acetyltransferase [Paenibacillus sp. HWE-109]